jgi:minor histocompatibility antigen H13
MTIVVMHTFKSAQPALLYLSPACIGSMCLLACVRREWAGLWAFDDASDDDPKKTLEEKDGEKVEGEKGVVEVGESTSIEVEGQRVLRGRVKK